MRDELSLNISKKLFDIKNVFQVCDPTFLCNISSYLIPANKAKIELSEKFILAYILDPNPEIGWRLEKLSIDKNIKVIIILDHESINLKRNKENLYLSGNGNIEMKYIVDLNEWLWY